MLTEGQKSYLANIPESSVANIHPWDFEVARYAEELIRQIGQGTGLEVLWIGSLALGVVGQNDIDLYIFTEPQYFAKHLPSVVRYLGNPTYKLEEKVLWRVTKDGHKIDASLISKNNPEVRRDVFFFNSLKNDPDLLKEYTSLKTPGLSVRDYYVRKSEFYNRVTERG